MTAEQTHMHRPAGLLTAVLWPFISWWMGGKIRAKRRALFGGYFGSWSCLMEDTYTFLCGEIWALLLCVMKQLIFLYLLCPAIRFFASFPSLPPAPWCVYYFQPCSLFFFISALLLPPANFHFFLPFSLPQYHYLLPSHSFPAHFYLSLFIYHLLCNVLI